MIRRREFITLVGGAVAWPLAARAQQQPVAVVGYLSGTVPRRRGGREDLAFRQGLREAGFVEGQNATVEYRYAENQTDRLSLLAADLVRRREFIAVAPGEVQERGMQM